MTSNSTIKYALKRSTVWTWLTLALVSLGVAALALRQNNLHMIALKENVLKVDQQNGDTEKALQELRAYVYSHMNTNTATNNGIRPSVQLKYRYERLVAAEEARVAAINQKVNNDAQTYCEKLFPQGLSGRGRVPCVSEYVSQNGVKAQPIQDGQYKFDFVSPRWAPDLPGFAILLTGFFSVLFIVSFGLEFRHSSLHR